VGLVVFFREQIRLTSSHMSLKMAGDQPGVME
jgi:hypothetical protein